MFLVSSFSKMYELIVQNLHRFEILCQFEVTKWKLSFRKAIRNNWKHRRWYPDTFKVFQYRDNRQIECMIFILSLSSILVFINSFYSSLFNKIQNNSDWVKKISYHNSWEHRLFSILFKRFENGYIKLTYFEIYVTIFMIIWVTTALISWP